MNDPSPSSKVRAATLGGIICSALVALAAWRGYTLELPAGADTAVGSAVSIVFAYLAWERRGTNPPPAE